MYPLCSGEGKKKISMKGGNSRHFCTDEKEQTPEHVEEVNYPRPILPPGHWLLFRILTAPFTTIVYDNILREVGRVLSLEPHKRLVMRFILLLNCSVMTLVVIKSGRR